MKSSNSQNDWAGRRWLRRLVRPHLLSTNCLSELIQSSTHPIIGTYMRIRSVWRHALVKIAPECGKRPLKLLCVWLLVCLPNLHNPAKAADIHKWTNSENRRAQSWQAGSMDLPITINPVVQLGLNLAEDSDKSVPTISPSLPPDAKKAKRASDATTDGSTQSGTCYFGYQFLMFSLGALISFGGLIWWQWIGS